MVLTEEEKKERKKESDRIWREKNKEKIREYDKKRYNKEYRKEERHIWYENNKEEIIKKNTIYNKTYRQTEQGKKVNRISRWKQVGIKCDDFDKLYDLYKNTNICNICKIELIEGKYGFNRKCLDHDHTTGLFRQILCNTCNSSTQRNIDKPKLSQAELNWKYKLKKFILS
tara:strand:+ start:89 stop:601 length:513 start_codon:yes stop_codon:yes gene_type:complete